MKEKKELLQIFGFSNAEFDELVRRMLYIGASEEKEAASIVEAALDCLYKAEYCFMQKTMEQNGTENEWARSPINFMESTHEKTKRNLYTKYSIEDIHREWLENFRGIFVSEKEFILSEIYPFNNMSEQQKNSIRSSIDVWKWKQGLANKYIWSSQTIGRDMYSLFFLLPSKYQSMNPVVS